MCFYIRYSVPLYRIINETRRIYKLYVRIGQKNSVQEQKRVYPNGGISGIIYS